MVIYDLVCKFGHEFEGWFQNSEELASQKDKEMLTCPFCNTKSVTKKITAPKVSKKSNSTDKQNIRSQNNSYLNSHSVSSELEFENNSTSDFQMSADQYSSYQNMLNKVHDYVENNFENVGNQFSEQALSIHYGETESKNIRGTATKEQIKELAEEGVTTLLLPSKPVDKKDLN